ncbi:MAG: hypothetical protein M9894_11615 [Planctomycetes bacterium]|nr:hypothetical protein [Planctomycetota bacterium]
MTRRPWPPALSLALVAVLAAAVLAPAQEGPDDLMKAAMQAHRAGTRCLEAGRKPGANQFLENEKAIGHFEQAQRLLERFLEARPGDPSGEALMQDVLSLLFWCHKMSPMVDPEKVPPEPPPAEPPPSPPPADGGPPPADGDTPLTEPPAEPPAPAATPEDEAEARRLLEQAREHQRAHPADGMGALARLFYVAERFPLTAAGREARAEAERAQATLFTAPPVAPARPRVEPLTQQDQQQIERALRDWLDQRRRLRCTSCKGQGSSPCRPCGATGELRDRAGRRSTCQRCRRGRVPCERRGCAEGLDVRALEKVVVSARAPYYQETLRDLLGGQRDAVEKYLQALAAVLVESPRAPAEISRAATELGIAPVQLRDLIAAHGPSAEVAREFTHFSLGEIDRKVRYRLQRGAEEREETATFEQQDGRWYLRRPGQ